MPRASAVRAYGVGILFAAALAACGETTRPDGGVGVLSVAAAAPEMVGEDAAGNPAKLSEFRKEHQLPFAPVADESGAAMTAYGVPAKYFIIGDRVTVLVDDQRKIAQVWPEVDPAVDADRVRAASKAISAGTPG